MSPESFIASRLRFKGKISQWAIAVSFLVMIMAVSISGGFRSEIRQSISEQYSDILLSGEETDSDTLLFRLKDVSGIGSITPVIHKGGIVKFSDGIQGVVFKGIPFPEGSSLEADIPSSLAEMTGKKEGDKILSYFIGEKTKARSFTIRNIIHDPVNTGEGMVVMVPIDDLRRIEGLKGNCAEEFEVRLTSQSLSRRQLEEKADQIGFFSLMRSESLTHRYARIFDWLDLIDMNVVAILILMTIVAGFNMISGLLIMLFRSISEIGTLKALGMTDKAVSGVFLRASAIIVAKGMAAGNIAALVLCVLQNTTHILKLNAENYFVSYVPIKVDFPYILCADAISFAVIMLLLLIPCIFIAGVDPSKTIRSE